MNTPYSVVYDRFLQKIEDYTVLKDIVDDPTYIQKLLLGFLNGAITKFTYARKEVHDRDNTLKQFNIILSERETEILSLLMVYEYLYPKLVRTETLEQRLGSKDFVNYSPAKLLQELRELRKSVKTEADELMVEYYYMERTD